MQSINELYGGGFLTARDVRDEEVLKIDRVSVEEVGEREKIVLSFDNNDKRLALNKINAKRIEELHGEDYMNEWVGKEITLFKSRTEYKGQDVDALRVKQLEE